MASKATSVQQFPAFPLGAIPTTLRFGKNNRYRLMQYGDNHMIERYEDREGFWAAISVDRDAEAAFDTLVRTADASYGRVVCCACDKTLYSPQLVNGAVACDDCRTAQENGEERPDRFFFNVVIPAVVVCLYLAICAIAWGGGR